jgi:HAE1 family hydrophobic/amphiphilic exporter-1
VGLVVDDAIVMLENIVRHIEEGVPPLKAALVGSREMGFTILSISISLVAVFIPIFFMPGVIGLLFHEFAAVVSLSILVSALVSLTLIPMLCARFLSAENVPSTNRSMPTAITRGPGIACSSRRRPARHAVVRGPVRMDAAQARGLDWCLAHRRVVLAAA